MIRPTMSHALNKEDLLELMSKYASYLEGQLAKANERVRELEARLTEDVIKDFSIRHRIMSLEEILNRCCPVSGYVISDSRSRDAIQDHIEQLRKEQE